MTKCILIIDDDPDCVKVLKKVLVQNGLETMECLNALDGVDMAIQKRPDLIILDALLPGGGAHVILDRLKQSSDTNAIPVIVISGLDDDERKELLMSKGVNAFIQKPYESKIVVATINRMLSV